MLTSSLTPRDKASGVASIRLAQPREDRPLQSRDIMVGGIRARLLEGGDTASSEAVVFMHGAPGSSEDWRPLMERTAPWGRVTALDMPGYGKSDKPRDFRDSMERGAEFIGNALDQLGITRAHLVLHDYGGAWGLRWAADHQQAFASVVLVDTGILAGFRWHINARIWRTPVLGELQMLMLNRLAFRWTVTRGCPQGLPSEFVDRMYDNLDWGTRRAMLRFMRNSGGEVLQRAEELHRLLQPLDRPALVVWGAADPYVPVRFASQQRRTFPNAEVTVLQQSGHFPFADAPREFEQAVLPFLRRQLDGHERRQTPCRSA